MNETAIFLFDYLHHMSESPEGYLHFEYHLPTHDC